MTRIRKQPLSKQHDRAGFDRALRDRAPARRHRHRWVSGGRQGSAGGDQLLERCLIIGNELNVNATTERACRPR